ncbi:hypothetical protein IMG5_165180 [Ichthyophthirius multifiliis]|uniref:Guanylate cyclase domain-containing protein n=1 Tax=Ichthyophthirius multifiliis TaxID=5932 RepID=G0R0J7_ICHMU|nr:hypothetical protein IMG5_165180 [Ichthyophthirius multifiliis]EGR29009.1 hypothetical protein IMG5_165180 [Ichthyophthirius multifiliis]|eukprot:XP_004030245.1 hypothetical protein IMG5_165180 [Ichthyophthirius multifiliis]
MTLQALFGDDIRVITSAKSQDIIYDGIIFACISLFTFEIILAVLAKQNYWLSFFFWLDTLSTLSLIFDLQILNQIIFFDSASNAASLAKAGRSSRVGSRTGRIIRIIKLIRIVKLYKAASKNNQQSQNYKQKIEERKKKKKNFLQQRKNSIILLLKKKKSLQYLDNRMKLIQIYIFNFFQFFQNKNSTLSKESRVSIILSDLTTKRVIIIVLLLLFLMPLFSAEYFYELPMSMDLATQQIKMIIEEKTTIDQIKQQFQDIINQHQSLSTPIVYFRVPLSYIETYNDNIEGLRTEEKQGIGYILDVEKYKQNHPEQLEEINFLQKIENEDDLLIQGFLNTHSISVLNSYLSIGRTIFVCFVLTIGSILFSKDVNDLAIGPIERMRNKVIQITKNPIHWKEENLKNLFENDNQQYETFIIENAIVKIGFLLALGFGDAGAEIITKNISQTGDFEALVEGKKQCAIYGFCKIRNFMEITEALQEDVLIFVNNIADILHCMVDRYFGGANRNGGESFLVVWKIQNDKYSFGEENEKIVNFNDLTYINLLADFSLISFLKTIVKMHREPKILAFKNDRRILNQKVELGIGLHVGWSIEGPIGSYFKIDATYISQNVTMASRLEGVSQQYGVPLIISEQMHKILSSSMQEVTRNIDRITFKENQESFNIYTLDLDCGNLPESKQQDDTLTKYDKFLISQFKKQEIIDIMNSVLSGENIWDINIYIQILSKTEMVQIPKTRKTYCKKCNAHQVHKVSQYKKSKESTHSQGRRRYDMKQAGYGGQSKPIFRKKAKTTKKVALKFDCTKCKTKRVTPIKRCKTVVFLDAAQIKKQKVGKKDPNW